MKQKYEGKDLQSHDELGREQGYLAFDRVDGFQPQDVSSPAHLRSAFESFQDLDIKVRAGLATNGAKDELDTEVKVEPDEPATGR